MKLLLLKNIVSQTKNRFRNLSSKSTALTMTLVVAGMLLSSSAFARQVTSFSVTSGQSKTPTYGTASTNIGYTLQMRENNNGGTTADILTITWSGGTPAGLTTSMDGAGQNFTPTGDRQNVNVTMNTTAATPAGTYTFTITNTDKNGGAVTTTTGTLTIVKKNVAITGTVTASNKPYDGTTVATVSGGTVSGAVAGDDVSVSTVGVFSSSAVGTNKTVTVALTGTDAGNYNLVTPPTVKANITAIPLTLTATGPAKTYGTALNTGTTTSNFTATGEITGENVTSVTLTPTGTGAPANGAAGSAYVVTPSAPTGTGGFLASNYTITVNAYNGTVTPATLTITANDITNKAYGTTLTSGAGKTSPATFTAVGLQNGQTITVTLTYATGGAATDPVGSYPNAITPSAATGAGFTASNYTITYNQGDITVIPATLTVKATNQTKAYGAAVPTLIFTTTGFVNGDNFTTQPTLTTTATAASNAGGYPITFLTQGTVSSNYTATYTPGTLTVSAEPSTYDWTGAINTTWNNPGNWNVNGIQQTSLYPGSTTNDDALIGVNEAIVNQPTLTANLPNGLNSLTFGNTSVAPILTINTGLTFSPGDFTVNANTTATLVDNGTVNVNGNYSNNATATLNISGSKSFTVTGGFTNLTNAGTLNQSGTGTVTFTTTTLAGAITNSGTINQSGTGSFNISILALVGTITNSGTINQTGNAAFTATINSFGGNIANTGTINQSSASGTMTFGVPYSNSTAGSKLIQTGTGTLAFSSTFNNAGTTTFGPGTVTVAGSFTNSSGTTTFGAGTATLASTFTNTSGTTAFGTGSASIASDYNNSGTVTTSTGPVTMSGAFTNNSGTTTFGTGLITFNSNGGSTKITMTPNATLTFVNVLFTNNGHFLFKTGGGASSSFAVASTGVLTLAGTSTQLDFANAIGLTLNSDASGSATIAAIPTGCTINAINKIFAQRFISGGGDINKRGYRLLSSPVFTGNDGTSNVSDLQYLANSVHLSGVGYASNGFDVTSTSNPSIYLFREDVPPPPTATTVFTTGYNWKGVAKINSTPNNWMIGTQFKNDQANLLDTLTSLPVGNGVLYFFRGSISQAVLPISPPIDVTLTHQGSLNVGPITVRLWYSNAGNGLGNNLSFTSANTVANSGSTSLLVAGFALVGNPYPSTINWEKYNNPNAPNAIIGTNGLGNFIYEFNVDSKQYGVYEPVGNGTDFTSENPGVSLNGATNLIASGQGFFVQAGAAGQTLTFNESAKTSSLSSPLIMNNLMGKPVATVNAPKPTLNLKLVKDSLNSDEIVIRMSNKASAKYVIGEDAPDVDGSSALETLSSYSSDSSRLAINTIPFPGVKPEIVRVLADATASGLYTLTVPKLKNMPALYQVWLKDAFTADSVQLKETTSYPFTIDKGNAATFGNTRFTVVIRQDTAFAYKLLDFTASKTNHQSDVQLVWKTANEGNYTNFTVERSTDNGKTFTVVGGMAGTGAGNYSLVDKNPDKGRNLYRLKQEDINDSVTYSKVVDVQFGDVFSKLHIFPNPATHTVNLAIAEEGYYKGNYSISFVNSSGRVVKEVQSSQADWQGNITYLMPGTYLVRVVNTKTQSLVGENKFVKL